MVKNYIYLNTLFLFGLLMYILSQNFSFKLNESFYLFFCLFSIIIPILFLINNYNYANEEEKKAYYFLFLGFCLYGIGNFLWYFNDTLSLGIDINYINILFFIQVVSKHSFFKFLLSCQEKTTKNLNFSKIISVNMGVLVLAVVFSNIISLDNFIYDFYFIFESIISIYFIYYYLFNNFSSHLDLKYFMIGNIFWLLGDCLFLFEFISGKYFIGNIPDFVYFVGFYFMLGSVIFKNFNFMEKLNFYFDTKLNFG